MYIVSKLLLNKRAIGHCHTIDKLLRHIPHLKLSYVKLCHNRTEDQLITIGFKPQMVE